MAGATPALRSALLNEVLGRAQWTGPGSVWVSLHTADPGTSGANVAPGTARKVASFSTPALVLATEDVPEHYRSANASAIIWPPFSAAATITHACLWSASSAGTLLLVIELVDDVAVDALQGVRFTTGQLEVTL